MNTAAAPRLASHAPIRLAPGRLEAARKARNLTPMQLAGLCSHGTTGSKSVEMWEQGKWQPGEAQFAKLVRILHTTADYLLGNSDEMTPPDPAPEPEPDPAAVPAVTGRSVPPGKSLDRIDGKALKALRVRKKLTIRGLSDLTRIGQSTYHSWETDRYTGIGREKVAYVAQHLDAAPEVLAGLWPVPPPLEQASPAGPGPMVPPLPPESDGPALPAVSSPKPFDRRTWEEESGVLDEQEPEPPAIARTIMKGQPITVEDALKLAVTVPVLREEVAGELSASTLLGSMIAQFEVIAKGWGEVLADLKEIYRRVEQLEKANAGLEKVNARHEADKQNAVAAERARLKEHSNAIIALMQEKVAELGNAGPPD